MQSINYVNGTSVTLAYDANSRLHTVTDNFGNILTYTFDTLGRLTQVTDPGNNAYVYGYDSLNNLIKVTYPDTSSKVYQYTDSNHPNSLTGIRDENQIPNVSYLSWAYDSLGRAYSTQFAGGLGAYTITYGATATQASTTTPSGMQRSLTMSSVNGRMRITNLTLSCTGCTSLNYGLVYDANGNIKSRTDYRGITTTYVYDLTRNLETSRTEASGTSTQRTITTVWDPVFRLPTKITEPGRITEYSYDSHGNRALYRITDSTTGSKREIDYANVYNPVANDSYLTQITATGPRTDLTQTTVYKYDTSGNLHTVTDALGHTTTYANYNSRGQVGTMTDPNGVITTYSYSLRGWLNSKTVTVSGTTYDTTSYSYWPTGLLKQVLLNTGVQLNYTYDNAHRLTDIVDGAGNRIHYDLDNAGNILKRRVTDSTGVLTMLVDQVNLALGFKRPDPYAEPPPVNGKPRALAIGSQS